MVHIEYERVIPAPRANSTSESGLLGYLDALTYTFHHGARDVHCVLVYSEPDTGGQYRFVVAADTGFEGIACLDDTARAALLGLAVYERSRSRRALTLATRWLSFVDYMQYPDGSFANFIRNASGTRNASGPTSHRGGQFWSVRALWALARAYRLTGKRSYLESYERCRLEPTMDGKINAVRALAEMELFQMERSDERRVQIMEYIGRILALADPYFRDNPDTDAVSLWGYHQLHAVASAARLLDEPALLVPCRRSIQNLVEPDVRARFWHSYPDRRKDGVCAYSVAPIVQGLAAMYRATNAERYRKLALDGAAWFYGRNDARTAMYDPTTGRCRDGITDGVASRNYGAESSVEAGFAELERRSLIALP